MALFTTNPVRPNVQVSSLFKDAGDTTGMPSKISDVQIYGLLDKTNLNYKLFVDNIALHAQASAVVEDGVPLSTGYKIEPLSRSYFQPPQVGVSFRDSSSPAVVNFMREEGFNMERIGRQVLFRGTLKELSLGRMIELGADPDTYTPYGICSINGYIAFKNIERITMQTLSAFPNEPFLGRDGLRVEFFGRINPTTENYHASPPDIEGNRYDKVVLDLTDEAFKVYGTVLPYFDGMLLPDKEYVTSQVTGRYSSLTGIGQELLPTIIHGWRSAANTKAGMQVSHLLFAIDLALQSGARPFMLTDATRAYRGALLRGKKLRIYKNRVLHPTMSPSQMRSFLISMNGHGIAVSELVSFLNGLKPEAKKHVPDMVISEERFKTPRGIHNVLRRLVLTTDDTITIKGFLSRMTFKQDYWVIKDPARLASLPALLASKDFLDDSQPILYRDLSVMLTSNRFYSTLSAYGSNAPTLSNKVGMVIQIGAHKEGKGCFLSTVQGKPKPPMTSIPVFVVPLQDAATVWKDIIFKGILRVTLNQGKAVGSITRYSVKTSQGIKLARELSKYCHVPGMEQTGKKDTGVKRKAEDGGLVAERDAKRIKMASSEIMIAMGSLGLTSTGAAHAANVETEGSVDSEGEDGLSAGHAEDEHAPQEQEMAEE